VQSFKRIWAQPHLKIANAKTVFSSELNGLAMLHIAESCNHPAKANNDASKSNCNDQNLMPKRNLKTKIKIPQSLQCLDFDEWPLFGPFNF